MNRCSQIGQHGAALLGAGVDGRLESGRKGVAARAAAAPGALAPEHEAAELALGVVVGWLDPGIVDEAPQRRAVLEGGRASIDAFGTSVRSL